MKKVMAMAMAALLSGTSPQAIGQTPAQLGGACLMGKVDDVKKLIAAGVDVNGKFNLGAARDVTPLRFACMFSVGTPEDRVEIVKLLIAAGAHADETNLGMSLLHHAVMYAGHPAIIEPLVEAGLNVNAQNTSGQTALHGAGMLGKTEWAEALIRNGADVNASSKSGETPLDLAVSNNKKEVADLLRKHGGVPGKR